MSNNFILFYLFFYKGVKLVGGGSVINIYFNIVCYWTTQQVDSTSSLFHPPNLLHVYTPSFLTYFAKADNPDLVIGSEEGFHDCK